MLNFFFKRLSKRVVARSLTDDPESVDALKEDDSLAPQFRVDQIVNSKLSVEEKIRRLKALATKLKKVDWKCAADTLGCALEIARANHYFESVDTELRFAKYLFHAGRREQAFNEISRLIRYGAMFEPYEPDTEEWYSHCSTCLDVRSQLLKLEATKESLCQYVFDRALSDHYKSMRWLRYLERLEAQDYRASSVEEHAHVQLQLQLRLTESNDFKKFGIDGLNAVGLGNSMDEFVSVVREYAINPRTLKFSHIENWLINNVK